MSSAVISPCGTYRYVLTRGLDTPVRWVKPILFIMLNPSTADDVNNDATIRRCIGFGERESCTKLTVVNLFALRATDPKQLPVHVDPIGPLNDKYLKDEIEKHKLGLVIAAWGANSFAQKRALDVTAKFGPFKALALNKNGSPKHPLYLDALSMIVDYE